MSYSFDGTDDHLRIATAMGPDATVSFWFYPTDTTTTTQTLYIQQDATANSNFAILLNGATGVLSHSIVNAGAPTIGASVSGVNFNAWNHVVSLFASANGNGIALNGGSWNTAIGNATGSYNRVRVGAKQTVAIPATFANFFTGRIAELTVWGGDLEAVNSTYRHLLAKRYSPYFVKETFESLTASYWPFIEDGNSLTAGPAAGVNFGAFGGAAIAAHCPRIVRCSGGFGARAA